ncbi:hypothetical protein Poli38472_005528 [Pythium oligandrum]|uniref:Peptidyl-prolyl cis-trans isomerase n=1 Tax=Pythium oligandrum TaxID=41045 RepID=A0A8K1FGM0_PYTOL|nr:hypothetical protein Poli38472_005528 [Pythium oligandrum]|eukprot:TMW62910.1 hypothetical protein Poli38472_005528 [Pythium oligandrum]
MLPRNSPRLHPRDKRSTFNARRLILGLMFLVFVSYFVVMNVFFTFPATPGGDNQPEQPAGGKLVDQVKAAAANAFDAEAPVDEPKAAKDTAEATPTETKWMRNPNRKYVWLDVAIDDEFIGRVTVELYADLVPKTAENFRALTTGELGPKYSFKNSVCHRILKGFIVQCGDFTTGKGYGGRSIYGNKFDDEPNGLRLTHSKRYILQMANSGPNTNGSQFCFMLGAAPHLNGHHVVFGEVMEGFEVVDKMEAAGVERDGVALPHKVSLIDGGELL